MHREPDVIVSVIVAVYNAGKYLQQCLESIAKQTYRKIEIICVNDGSTDNSLEIMESFAAADERFRIYTKENEGLGGASARNFGLAKAQGKYISILDSDDFFDPEMLDKAVKKAEKTGAEIVVFGGSEYDDRNGNVYRVVSILDEGLVPEREVFSYLDCSDRIYQISQGMAWNKLYRKDFLDKHGLQFQKIKYTDDAYFTFAHMVLAEKITVLKEGLCYYRVNTGTSQTDGFSDYPDSSYMPYVSLKKSLVEWGIYDDVKRSFVNCAASFMRYCYDKLLNRYEPFCYLHDKYRNEIFDFLDITTTPMSDFNEERTYIWSRQVLDYSPGEILFKAVRAYGSENTTSILRLPFPYDKIKKNSRIVILGSGVIGRHYCAQIMLSRYCDVVAWVEEVPSGLSYVEDFSALDDIEFDYALIAYAQQWLIDHAVKYLKSIGVKENKMILGGLCE